METVLLASRLRLPPLTVAQDQFSFKGPQIFRRGLHLRDVMDGRILLAMMEAKPLVLRFPNANLVRIKAFLQTFWPWLLFVWLTE